MIWLIFSIAFMLSLFLEAWYDWTADTGRDSDFLVDRLRKVAKTVFLLLIIVGSWFLEWKGIILYVGLRFFLFSFFYYSLRFGRIFLNPGYYWLHSELYYWILIIAGKRPQEL